MSNCWYNNGMDISKTVWKNKKTNIILDVLDSSDDRWIEVKRRKERSKKTWMERKTLLVKWEQVK